MNPLLVKDSENPAEVFERHFKTEEAALEKLIEQLSDPALGGKDQEKADLASQCSMGIARLTNDTRLAADSLVAYFKRRYSERLKALSKNLEEARSTYAPRPKFSLKSSFSRDRQPNPRTHQATPTPSTATFQPPPLPTPTIPPQSSTCITLPATPSILLNDIIHSVIYLPATHPPPTSAETSNITSSLLLLGAIDGPARIRGLKNSILVIAAHQLRLHHCTGCTIYLSCRSRPLIEFCTDLKFAPLPSAFAPSTPAFAPSPSPSQSPAPENWSRIDDLQFPSPSISPSAAHSSPNWRFLAPGEAVREEVWTEILAEGMEGGLGREGVLGAVGLLGEGEGEVERERERESEAVVS